MGHQGAASYDTVQVQRHPQAVAKLVHEKPPTLLMLDPRSYPLAQDSELEFDIPASADAFSCKELKPTLVDKGP